MMPNRFRRIAVCGGRDFVDAAAVKNALDALLRKYPDGELVIVHGACPTGVDHIANGWVWMNKVHVHRVPCRRDMGRAGGPFRNRQIARSAEGCVAFPGGSGTADMVACCEALDLKVWWPIGGRAETMDQLRKGWKL